MYGDEPLKDYYTLMDIAYFYEWRRVSERRHPEAFFGGVILRRNDDLGCDGDILECLYCAVHFRNGVS